MAKRKPKTQPQLIKDLDRVFSRWIRFSALLEGKQSCYTCSYVGDPKKMHAGHWIPRQHKAVRWEHWNVHPQCYSCNMFYGGRPQEYRERLVEEFGEEAVAAFALRRHEIRQWRKDELEDLIEKYKSLVKCL